MTPSPPRSIRLGFERDCVEVPLDKIRFTVALPVGIKESVVYRRVSTSINAIGLVEPIVVALDRDQVGTFIVLDGFVA